MSCHVTKDYYIVNGNGKSSKLTFATTDNKENIVMSYRFNEEYNQKLRHIIDFGLHDKDIYVRSLITQNQKKYEKSKENGTPEKYDFIYRILFPDLNSYTLIRKRGGDSAIFETMIKKCNHINELEQKIDTVYIKTTKVRYKIKKIITKIWNDPNIEKAINILTTLGKISTMLPS